MWQLRLVGALVLVLGSVSGTYAQEMEDVGSTALEQALSHAGSLRAKEFHELGELSGRSYTGLECTAVVVTDPQIPGQSTGGMKITALGQGGTVRPSKSAYLDLSEVHSLIAALDYMIQSVPSFPLGDSKNDELEFSTKGAFSVALFESKDGLGAVVTCGRVATQHCWLKSPDDLANIRTMVQRALEIIE